MRAQITERLWQRKNFGTQHHGWLWQHLKELSPMLSQRLPLMWWKEAAWEEKHRSRAMVAVVGKWLINIPATWRILYIIRRHYGSHNHGGTKYRKIYVSLHHYNSNWGPILELLHYTNVHLFCFREAESVALLWDQGTFLITVACKRDLSWCSDVSKKTFSDLSHWTVIDGTQIS